MGYCVSGLCWVLPLFQLPTNSEAKSVIVLRGFILLMCSAFTELYFFEKRVKSESFCSVMKAIASYAEQRFACLLFFPGIKLH